MSFPIFPTPARGAPPSPRAPSKGERTAERILDAGEKLFAEHGYAGTTLRDVASAVGIRTPSLYNHFASKEALYAAVLERGIRPLMDALAELVARPNPAGGKELLELAMRVLGDRPNLPRLVQYEIFTGGARLTSLLADWIAPLFESAEHAVRQDAEGRQWSPAHVPLLVIAIYHVVVGYFTIAPFYRELGGVDLLSGPALEAQTSFLNEMVSRLVPTQD